MESTISISLELVLRSNYETENDGNFTFLIITL